MRAPISEVRGALSGELLLPVQVAAAVGPVLLVAGYATDKLGLAAVAALGLAGLPLLLTRPRIMLVALVVTQVANLGAVSAGFGFPNLVLALLLASFACLALDCKRRGWMPVFTPVLWFAAAYFAARFLSLLVAPDTEVGLASVEDTAKDLVIFAVVLALCIRTGSERLVAQMMVAVVAGLCLLDLLREFVIGNDLTFFGLLRPATVVDVGLTVARHTGPVADPNFWGRILAMIAPFALALFADRTSSHRQRVWWLAAFITILGGVYLTGSRGTLLVVIGVVVVWMLLAGHRYIRALPFALLTVFVALLIPGIGSRLMTIGDLTTTAGSAADTSLTGRVDAAKIGAQMFVDRPILGIGVDNFGVVVPAYERFYGISGAATAPHDLYLQVAAESGVLGLLAWTAFYVACLWVAVRAWRSLHPASVLDRPRPDWLLSGAVLASLVGWGLAGILLHVDNLRIFDIVAAVGVTLLARAPHPPDESGGRAPSPRSRVLDYYLPPGVGRLSPRAVLPIVVFVLVASVAAATLAVPERPWSATERVHTVAATGGAPVQPYTLSVQARDAVSLTYLELLNDPVLLGRAQASAGFATTRPPTTVSVTPDGAGVLTVTVTGSDPSGVSAVLDTLPRVVGEGVAWVQPLYRLEVVPGSRGVPRQ